jgi:hypothetical protein
LRDCQDDLTKLPKYVSGWSEVEVGGQNKAFTRRPVELDGNRYLHAGVRYLGPWRYEIIVRIGDR